MSATPEQRDDDGMIAWAARWGRYTNLVPISSRGTPEPARPERDWHVLVYGAGRYSAEWVNREANKQAENRAENATHIELPVDDKRPFAPPKTGVKVASVGLRGPTMDDVWLELASARDTRLPHHATACTPGKMRHWLRQLGLSDQWFREWSGYKQLRHWMAANPHCGLREWVGLLLEELS